MTYNDISIANGGTGSIGIYLPQPRKIENGLLKAFGDYWTHDVVIPSIPVDYSAPREINVAWTCKMPTGGSITRTLDFSLSKEMAPPQGDPLGGSYWQ